MSPRLASASTSTPSSRRAAIACSSTAKPAEPYASKHAACGLTTAKPENADNVDAQPPCAQQLGVRVDAQTQRPALRHRVSQAVTEPAHRQEPSTLWSSCSDITPMSPRMPASMPCTAAEAPCTVVTHGMFIDTAAERISYPAFRVNE